MSQFAGQKLISVFGLATFFQLKSETNFNKWSKLNFSSGIWKMNWKEYGFTYTATGPHFSTDTVSHTLFVTSLGTVFSTVSQTSFSTILQTVAGTELTSLAVSYPGNLSDSYPENSVNSVLEF